MNITAQTRKIYSSLRDDLSRKVFENRLLYSLTANPEFIRNVVKLTTSDSLFDETESFLEQYNDIIIYGAGIAGRRFFSLNNLQKITAFCDIDKEKQKSSFLGCKVISPDELIKDYKKAAVILSLLDEKIANEVNEKLLQSGFRQNQIMIYRDLLNKHWKENSYSKQYFAPDIVIPDTNEEIFVDGGCYDCGTSIDFIKWRGDGSRRIIAFEPNPAQYLECLEASTDIENMTMYPQGLWNDNVELCFDTGIFPSGAHIAGESNENSINIKAVRLDDVLKGEKITFLKLDVEGAELNALKGAEQTILKHRPKLALCIYHKPEDVWEIPEYILSLHDDYKLYIRHYSLGGSETVLYAV